VLEVTNERIAPIQSQDGLGCLTARNFDLTFCPLQERGPENTTSLIWRPGALPMTMIAHRLIDLSRLRDSANFRRLWIGTTSQSFGATFTSLAVLYQVWELHNPFWTGAVAS
jgi:hypothetical protein